ncbi:amidohydrolase [Bacillus salipaludis]|uniref:Amidohydrolase n=1 Tax=Bacillus salipaludis TaxID=2547811 RepID=A0A4R5VR08_9BACI|nr:M20 peptidase aminoacylase family protein [Bacillus salipaludis]MDQ6598647.1 M20 peptidase aminoacylase family protein [Bacillus salipaludis]TDK60809.1 amidohydrolase [Bacillus salipaludis]
MKKTLEKLSPIIFELFEHLHQNPEVSWKEVNTTSFIANFLKSNGCEVRTFPDHTGVIGELGNGPLTVGVRADMDSLWQEVNGRFQANHSCGHDAHMTMVLGTLLLLKEMQLELPGRLKLIFQPAEEVGDGALKMIEKQVIDDIDFLYGVHLRPIQELTMGTASPGIIHGAAETVSAKIIGFDAHGARPDLGVNAIEVISAIVEQLKGIRLNPFDSFSVKMTQVSAGGDNTNVIPGSAQFHLDLRAQKNETMDRLVQKVDHILQQVASLFEVKIEFEHKEKVYAAVVNPKAQKIMAKAIAEVIGAENVMPAVITPGAEDFHFYTKERPHLKAAMLGLGCDLAPGLHHPYMSFNRDALLNGIEILTRTVLATFKQN